MVLQSLPKNSSLPGEACCWLRQPCVRIRPTRHNVGFDVLDRLSAKILLRTHHVSDSRAFCWRGRSLRAGAAVEAITFANRSGEALAEAARCKIDVRQDLLVVVDDLALSLWIASLPVNLAEPEATMVWPTSSGVLGPAMAASSHRHRSTGSAFSNYVLGKFTPQQQTLIDPALDRAAEAVEYCVHEGTEAAAQKYHTPENRTPTQTQTEPIASSLR